MLAKEQVAIYSAWISDLSALGYVWPIVNRTSLTISRELLNQSREQVFFNSASKEKKQTDNESTEKYVRNECKSSKKTKYAEANQNACLFDKFILVTRASNLDELSYIQHIGSVNFAYVVICTDLAFRNIVNSKAI